MAEKLPDVVDKWGAAVAARGFAQIPNYLLEVNRFIDPSLRLKPLELLILIELIGSWWKKSDQPFPSMKTLALKCGSSERQVHRALTVLESAKLISKSKRRVKGIISSNSYDLQPLVEALAVISENFINDYPRTVRRVSALTKAEVEVAQSLINRRFPGEWELSDIYGDEWELIASPTSFGFLFKDAVVNGVLKNIEYVRTESNNHAIYRIY